jgi:hypothetical protein
MVLFLGGSGSIIRHNTQDASPNKHTILNKIQHTNNKGNTTHSEYIINTITI